MKRNLIILAVAVALLLISIKFFPYHCNCQVKTAVLPASTHTGEVEMDGREVTIGTSLVSVDVADTPALREQGLSGRKSLCADCGMLFVFETPGLYGFWMKEMNFPIDMVWVSADKKVVSITKSATPASYPNVFRPSSPVLYVVELPNGYAELHHIQIGDPVSIN